MHSGVVTVLAAAFRSAGRADGKALAVQLQTSEEEEEGERKKE